MALGEGLSQAAVSERLGMPLGTVKSHARRGLLRLRELAAQTMGSATASAVVSKGGETT
jgi:RNA polymerase sigma-70 factor (ECF subfamily)